MTSASSLSAGWPNLVKICRYVARNLFWGYRVPASICSGCQRKNLFHCISQN